MSGIIGIDAALISDDGLWIHFDNYVDNVDGELKSGTWITGKMVLLGQRVSATNYYHACVLHLLGDDDSNPSIRGQRRGYI